MSERPGGDNWRSKIVQPKWPWGSQTIRPADIADGLSAVMFAKENTLEDAYYQKIVPNRFIVEVNAENFTRNFEMIQAQVVRQWIRQLLDQLATANSRLGRKEYSLGGPVQVEVRPAQDLLSNQARILFRVQTDRGGAVTPETGGNSCLEMTPGRRRWQLRPGITTLGRYDICDVYLDLPEIQERRLVSGQHAYIRSEANGTYRIFDGSPSGKSSVNGTFVNYQRVPPGGHVLQNGDLIILAAVDPNSPRTGVPGTGSFYFYQDCSP